MKIDEIKKRELFYKLETVKQFLIFNGGHEYQLYNHICPSEDTMPDSNIVEYLEDIEQIVSDLISSEEDIRF